MINTDRQYQPILLKLGFLLFLLVFAITNTSNAQFVNLRLNIDAEITARTERPLNFGTLSTNSGRRLINLGNSDMGIFSITALENQMLLVNISKPTELRHSNPAIDTVIPLELFSRYSYSIRDYQNSIPIPQSTQAIKLESNPEPGPWNSIYIFMYGAIEIGDVPEGTYSNEIVLSVEYI